MKREWYTWMVALLVALMVTACGRDPARPDDAPTDAAVGRPDAESEAPTQAPAIPPPFDLESHHAAVRELTPAHHAGMARVRAAIQAREDYEAENRRATPERTVIADALDALEAADASDRKQQDIAEARAQLTALFAEDEAWQALDAEVRAAIAERDAARNKIVALIQQRMRYQAEREQARERAGDAADRTDS